ncbi:NAD-dependent epimerase/dehydratase family protein [Prochlorococcus sp. AH-736-A21]|nr:NAD-dependent epimerase/dehydratase family protein [Prochlorococcus sp. AH-736-A21]
MALEKVLVAGGSGFIGHHIVKECKKNGYKVISISLKIPEKFNQIEDVDYYAHDLKYPIEGDLVKSLEEVRYIINSSGYIDHSQFCQRGFEIYNQHYLSVINLIKFSKLINLKTFINFGSSDEYGLAKSPISETQREEPFSPYSLSKLNSTHLLRILFEEEKFPSVVIRPFLVYGERQNSNRFLPQIIKSCLNDEEFKVTKGEQLRDFLYVGDFAEAVNNCLDNKNIYGEIFNIASGKPVSIKNITELVNSYIGKGNPDYGARPYRKGENMELYADIRKSKMLINWEPKTKFIDVLSNIVDWYNKNQ